MWEYHVYPWTEGSAWGGESGLAGIKTMLNHFGAEGWELISRSDEGGGHSFYFKRPKVETSGIVW